jgi:molybdopterin molybdotransferase
MIVTFEQARQLVEEHARQLRAREAEHVDLVAASGRVLAQEIVADRDLPPFARATRDGFAVRSAEVANPPARLRVAGEIRAGAEVEASNRALQPGEGVAIMTGAPLPPNADAVVMVEHTAAMDEQVEVRRRVAAGENVVARGAEARVGQTVLSRGTRVGAAQVALAASCGYSKLLVSRRPRVAILSTGDEVVEIAVTPGPNQIRNSNSYALAAQVARAGGEPVQLPIAPDRSDELRHLLQHGLALDLLLISGGVSMGRHDLVEPVLKELDAEFFFTGAEIQPGRPIVFGRAPGGGHSQGEPTYFFGLPGNPISTLVCFELFARAMVEALCGGAPEPLRFVTAELAGDVRVKPGLTRFLPAFINGSAAHLRVATVPWQGSGDLAALARANCLLVAVPDRESMAAGEMVSALIF